LGENKALKQNDCFAANPELPLTGRYWPKAVLSVFNWRCSNIAAGNVLLRLTCSITSSHPQEQVVARYK